MTLQNWQKANRLMRSLYLAWQEQHENRFRVSLSLVFLISSCSSHSLQAQYPDTHPGINLNTHRSHSTRMEAPLGKQAFATSWSRSLACPC